ncbi:Ig-like domain-containing protein [Streptomyces sp. CHB9.2]|uniref:Ig-like domain-containing protein n=1 Tax=Streptomyces sp. CHB9.2 TaxID=2841670 RepID=UPI0020962FF5|nr:hypothetical protein [Streptomyces sp. CHB9.2]MCO6704726.1 hypothetical protein [Streptomyces sp. CHB9.2]
MPMYMQESKVSLLNYLNAKNATSFKLTDLVFSAPQVINGTWRGVANPHNTAVRVTADAGSIFQGTVVITYDRLELKEIIKIPGFILRADHPTSAYGLLDQLATYNGLNFTTDDIEDSPVTDNGDGTYTVTLTAKAGSYGWVGSVTIANFGQGGAPLDRVLSGDAMPGLNYPTSSDGDVYGALYLYSYDFTDFYDLLLDLEPGVPLSDQQAADLAAAINELDVSSGAGAWNNSPDLTQFSLQGAVPFYNGLNMPEFLSNSSYKYALLLDLRVGVTIPKGRMVLHFNDPIDSGSV